MDIVLPAILALLIGIAGWYYAFYSDSAKHLLLIESAPANRRRINLRRAGGIAMILLGVAFYVCCESLRQHRIGLFALMLAMVLILMMIALALAFVDLRMTRKLREQRERESQA